MTNKKQNKQKEKKNIGAFYALKYVWRMSYPLILLILFISVIFFFISFYHDNINEDSFNENLITEEMDCVYNPYKEVMVSELFYSEDVVVEDNLTYELRKICSVFLLYVEEMRVHTLVNEMNFPYVVPSGYVVEIEYISSSMDVYNTEEVPQEYILKIWSATHQEIGDSFYFIKPCLYGEVLLNDGKCYMIDNLNRCSPGFYFKDGMCLVL